ncbi:phosphatidylglycerophosphatase [Malonomonas rubra DSM 5091]|uniref:Phosphatidylglycerophosphatase n=1 Tax=Malonomonas rubra DSM 5091 TaxID=1122189 RepID=A0A1M6LQG1_MALRU|nr:phosphatidylglycerophosphatase A [Malonomonas rubra]SHJ73431.1 phosphatidylglycerophosphatase [Malonomonas rubra DSM 5091]
MNDIAQGAQRKLILFLASNAGLGYAPVASGTFGSLMGIPFFYYISGFNWFLQLLTFIALLFLSFWSCNEAGKIYGEADDGRIVIDELIGYLAAVLFLPFSWGTAIIAFFWFRLFDITKPQPAKWFDKEMKNGVGVTLDDLVAGIYAAIALRLCLWIF